MGFGLPASIGAKVASPEKIVVDIDGDASFSMTAMEMATAAQYGIGVKVILSLVHRPTSSPDGFRTKNRLSY